MAERAVSTYTYEAYLELEANPAQKYEYHDGMITAMAGGTPEHGKLTVNAGRAIENALEAASRDCSVYSSDVKIRVENPNRTFYPDMSVVCGPTLKSEKDKNAIINPTLIVEVLSDSTANFDRGAKFSHYRQLESFRQYILISQDRLLVDSFYRTEEGLWEIQTYQSLEDEIRLKSLDISINMATLYYRLEGLKAAE